MPKNELDLIEKRGKSCFNARPEDAKKDTWIFKSNVLKSISHFSSSKWDEANTEKRGIIFGHLFMSFWTK
jgi:hypothetical protein